MNLFSIRKPPFHIYKIIFNCFEGAKVDCAIGHEELKLKIAFDLINKKLLSFIPSYKKNDAPLDLLDESRLAVIDRLKTIRNKILSLKLVFIQLDEYMKRMLT